MDDLSREAREAGARVNTCSGFTSPVPYDDRCVDCGHRMSTHQCMSDKEVAAIRRAASSCLTEHMNNLGEPGQPCQFCGTPYGWARDYHGANCPQRLIYLLCEMAYFQVVGFGAHPAQVSYIWPREEKAHADA